MIKLYRPTECSDCYDIEATLKEMVVAHKVVVVESDQTIDGLDPKVALPAIIDNGQTICGLAAIATYLEELERFVADWRRFQSDSCYIDDDGKPC